jgi:hypothetical protein
MLILILLGLQAKALEAQGGPSRLSGPEKRQLAAIAREPIAAAIEMRPMREPQVSQRLMAAQPVAVSIYLDGKLLARSWELARPGPLAAQTSSLAASLLTSPNYGKPPDASALPNVKVGVSVFYRFRQIKDDTELEEGEGAVVMSGFREGVAVPADLPPGHKPGDLLSLASEVGGMRPGAWLLPEAAILAAQADDEREK